MKLQTRLIKNHSSELIRHAPTLVKAGLRRLVIYLDRKLSRGCTSFNSWSVYKKLASSGLSKARSEIKFFSKILKNLKKFSLQEELEEGRALRMCIAKKPSPGNKCLVTRTEFLDNCRKLIGEGSGGFVLAFYSMLASGRRLVDLRGGLGFHIFQRRFDRVFSLNL